MADPKSRMEGYSKLNIGRRSMTRVTRDPFRGQKVRGQGYKVTSHNIVCALRRESHVCVVVVTVNDFLASVACSVTFD